MFFLRRVLPPACAGALALSGVLASPAAADPTPTPAPVSTPTPTSAPTSGKAPPRPDDAGYYRHGNRPAYKVLVFTKGAEPAVAEAGTGLVRRLGREQRFAVDATADAAAFTPEKLADYRAVIFLGTGAGDLLDAGQQAAFEEYFTAGGGYVGLSSAAATEPSWSFYTQVVGTTAGQATATAAKATVKVADRVHPAGKPLPERWQISERWYDYAANVRGTAHVLATVDESTYTGGGMGADHPISWCRDYRGGRTWYTGLGLSAGTYADRNFAKHLLGGIEWASGAATGDCGATVLANYEKVTLNDEPGEPMTMAVLPDGRVLHNTRNGQIRLYDPATGLSPVITTIPVYSHDEDGLQSVAIDPGFARNKWVYFYYAPPLNTPVDDPATPGVNEGDAPVDSADPTVWDKFKGYNVLARAKLVEEPTPHLDLTTRQEILRVDSNRGTCCHVGGEIRFDGRGLLYLATGDDTNAGGSDGYTPINEAATRNPAYDAQRSSANTNDLRGKMLRIKVAADGSYTIPKGNLFRPGTPNTRPEIYLMGLRNPFRYDVGSDGTLYIADYSPDARAGDHRRGPQGTGKWFVARKAGNWGWPYCATRDLPYTDFDFTTRTSGQPFDCAGGPVNDSPRNTGLTKLPPVERPEVWYSYTAETPARPPSPTRPAPARRSSPSWARAASARWAATSTSTTAG
ncbi:ThuA domain-containing protein [Thermocatellispora tengchongensis]|uniref:ThuA domain-containing protein n=1 Tax=Thermocatellispora tengchongensis TaxID=1073253 RepID=UPI00363865F9